MKNIVKIMALLSVGLVSASGKASESSQVDPLGQMITQATRIKPGPNLGFIHGAGDNPPGSGVRKVGGMTAVAVRNDAGVITFYDLDLLISLFPHLARLADLRVVPQNGS